MKLLIMFMYGFTETFYSKSFLFTTVVSLLCQYNPTVNTPVAHG